MFAFATAAGYADVFIKAPNDSDLTDLTFILLAVFGVAGIFIGIAFIDLDYAGWILGGGIAALIAAFCIGMNASAEYEKINTTVAKNMTENVQQKYGATLKLDKDRTDDHLHNLTEPRMYDLVFENGASAKYKMYFTETSEPMLVDDSKAPSVEELNKKAQSDSKDAPSEKATAGAEATAQRKTVTKAAPTPTELEESAKK